MVRPEHDEEGWETAIEIRHVGLGLTLQQLVPTLPLGPQLTLLLVVPGLQTPEPHALTGAAMAPG